MFVRLAFAVAINVNPDILIVDEALAVGDTRFQLKCMDKFIEFMEAGKTILFVSHDINMIKRFCKRCIWINEGRLIMDGDTDELTDRYVDFLKSGETIEQYLQKQQEEELLEQSEEEKIQSDLSGVEIAEIYDVTILDAKGHSVDTIEHGTPVRVRVRYLVNDNTVENPVLGVAIRSVDEEYICGVNTLLDQKKIKWEKGLNECILEYSSFDLTGGNYYFDAAIFDQTATVPINYKARVKDFFVKMSYIAEGVVVLQHKWN
jgi:ABC-type glutathione transport system ATPase component